MGDAHRAVHQEQHVGQHAGLTTLALLVVAGGRAAVAHVGDSRVYRLRAGLLEQLTKDHRNSRHTLTRCPRLHIRGLSDRGMGSARARRDRQPHTHSTSRRSS